MLNCQNQHACCVSESIIGIQQWTSLANQRIIDQESCSMCGIIDHHDQYNLNGLSRHSNQSYSQILMPHIFMLILALTHTEHLLSGEYNQTGHGYLENGI